MFSWCARGSLEFNRFTNFYVSHIQIITLPFPHEREFPRISAPRPNNYATLSEQQISTCVFEHFSGIRATLSPEGNGLNRINEEREREREREREIRRQGYGEQKLVKHDVEPENDTDGAFSPLDEN